MKPLHCIGGHYESIRSQAPMVFRKLVFHHDCCNCRRRTSRCIFADSAYPYAFKRRKSTYCTRRRTQPPRTSAHLRHGKIHHRERTSTGGRTDAQLPTAVELSNAANKLYKCRNKKESLLHRRGRPNQGGDRKS